MKKQLLPTGLSTTRERLIQLADLAYSNAYNVILHLRGVRNDISTDFFGGLQPENMRLFKDGLEGVVKEPELNSDEVCYFVLLDFKRQLRFDYSYIKK